MRIPNNVLCLWYAKMQMDAADPDYITLLNDSVDKSLIQISQSAHRLREAIRSKATRVAKKDQQLSRYKKMKYGEQCTTIDVQQDEVVNPVELQNDITTLKQNIDEMRYICMYVCMYR